MQAYQVDNDDSDDDIPKYPKKLSARTSSGAFANEIQISMNREQKYGTSVQLMASSIKAL